MDLDRIRGQAGSGARLWGGRSVAGSHRGEAGHHVGQDGMAVRVRIHR